MGQYEVYQVLKRNKGKWMTVEDMNLRGFKVKSKHLVQLARYCDSIELMRHEITCVVSVKMKDNNKEVKE